MKSIFYTILFSSFMVLMNTSVVAQKAAKKQPTTPKPLQTAPVEPPVVAEEPLNLTPMALIAAGTPVYLVTHNEMSTKYIKAGMTVCLYLKFPIKVEGYKVIPANTPAFCKVTQADKPHGNGRAGYIEVEPLYIQIKKDEVLPLTGNALVRVGRDREATALTVTQAGMAASGLMHQAQGMVDTKNAKRTARQQELGYQQAQEQAYALGYGSVELVQQATPPQLLRGPSALSQVAQTLNSVIPLVGLLIKGKHAIIPEGYILSAFVAGDTRVEVKE